MASVHDMHEARATYEGLLRLFRLAIPVIAVIAALVIFLLTR